MRRPFLVAQATMRSVTEKSVTPRRGDISPHLNAFSVVIALKLRTASRR